MTTKQKIMSYLKRCKTFKTTKTIAERTGCNYNTVRRCLMELYRDIYFQSDFDRCIVSVGAGRESTWLLTDRRAA